MVIETTSVTLPGWEVVRKLGEGSFGGVYEIQRTLPDGTVERAALKKLTVPKDPGEIEELYARSYDNASITAHFREQMQDLVREYAFMQKLGENPNVVHCQDLRTVQHKDGIGWDIYIRMELLKPLKIWLDDRYDERRVIRLGLNICGALNGCHQRNIIHRDIKPENILVTDDGRFKLGDFGIAKVSEKTATGTLTGTYSYMAPEIANRQHYGASADIYSLGLVMYWMMNECTLPFLPLSKKIPSGIQRQEAQDRRLSGEKIPAPINSSLELTEIVLKACAFDPKERYHSVQELAEDLKWHYQNLRSGTVRKPKPANQPRTDGWEEPTIGTGKTYEPPMQEEPPKKERKRWKPLVIAGIAVVLLCGLIFGVSLMNGMRLNRKIAMPEETIASTISVEETIPTTLAFTVPESAPAFVYTYEKNGIGFTITGYYGELPTEVSIPSEIDGLPVTNIGAFAFDGCESLRGVTIPESVTNIGTCAFRGCSSLRNITMPNGIFCIGNYAFAKCTNLNSITIPDSVTSIGNYAFYECTSLSSITIPDGVTSIGNYTFYECTSLSSITIPDNVTSIGESAFSECRNLGSVTIPHGVASIGEGAFAYCTSLRSITLPDSVAEIQNGVFAFCTSLNSITIPEGVSSIEVGAFRDCINLTSVTISRNCIVYSDAFPSTCQVYYY